MAKVNWFFLKIFNYFQLILRVNILDYLLGQIREAIDKSVVKKLCLRLVKEPLQIAFYLKAFE